MAAHGGGAGAGSWESAVSGDYPVSNGGGRGLISQLDWGQVLGTESAKQLPEALVFTAPPQPQAPKVGRGPPVSLCPRVSAPYASFWLSDTGEEVKAAYS